MTKFTMEMKGGHIQRGCLPYFACSARFEAHMLICASEFPWIGPTRMEPRKTVSQHETIKLVVKMFILQ